MKAPRRGGGRSSMTGRFPASLAWPSILVVGGLFMGLEPAPCTAQPPVSGMPTMPAVSGATDAQPSLEGAEAMMNVPGAMGNQPPSIPMPPRPDLGPQGIGPLPDAAVTPLPALSHDHYGDGAGTTGAGLIWPGQPPHPHDPFQDGAGKIGGPIAQLARITPHSSAILTHGTLGYGPPGEHPGFFGFGLSFHPGYGYGGNGLGVGALGGYPCYGGPGYPIHYGYPHFAYPYYEGIGQLYYDQPVVIAELMDAGDFGPYTGASAYAYTHPSYAAEAAATGSFLPGRVTYPDSSASNPTPEATFSRPETIAPGPGGVDRVPVQSRYLGMDVEPGLCTGDRKGLKIVNVLPGSTAANAGLQVGDVILSINGYVTEQLQHLTWIISNAAPDNILKMNVIRVSDGKEQTITIRMP